MRAGGRWIFGGAVVLVALWAAWETRGYREDPSADEGEQTSEPSSPGDPPGRRARAPGIVSRPVDSATDVGEEHMLDPSRRAEYAQAVDEAPDLLESLRAGERQWSDMLIDLDTSEDAQDAYEECSRVHLGGPCTYTVGFVVEPGADGMGRITYGRALSSTDASKECLRYASCMAKARVGDAVRVPRGVEGPVAHQRHATDNRDPSIEDDLEAHRKWLAEMEAGVALMLERGPDGAPDWEWRLALERSYVELLKRKIAKMEGS